MAQPRKPFSLIEEIDELVRKHEAAREAEQVRRTAAKLAARGRIVGSMTSLLRTALKAAPSLNEVEKATGVKRQSLALFIRGEQTSLRSEAADKLATYFQIVCSMPAIKATKRDR